MQKLLAVYTAKGPKGVICSGWTWVRGDKDAVGRCKSRLASWEVLQSVWVSEWQKESSTYRLVFGDSTASPPIDMAANLRNSRKGKTRLPKKEPVEKKEVAEATPAFVLITAIAAA